MKVTKKEGSSSDESSSDSSDDEEESEDEKPMKTPRKNVKLPIQFNYTGVIIALYT